MTSSTKSNFLITGGLLVLSFIPVVAGAARVHQLGSVARLTFAKRAALLGLLAWAHVGQANENPSEFPRTPYPATAAGWGPVLPNGLFVSRWANADLDERSEKALTFSSETRVRFDTYANGQLAPNNDYNQGLFRSVFDADARLTRNLRAYGEIGLGSVEGRRNVATPNFQNSASLQQLFLDARTTVITVSNLPGRLH